MYDPMLEHLYNPSFWVTRLPKEEVVKNHIETVTKASIAVKDTIPFEKGVRYGSRNNQKMDIYGRDTLPKDAPVFVYIHGGYWQDLDKDMSSYCVAPLYQSNIRVVVPDYDLAPAVSLDVIVEEIKELGTSVLQMAKNNGCINVWFGGHSAGAHLSAMLLSSDWFNLLNDSLKEIFKGLVLISGIYDITPLIKTSVNDKLGLTWEIAHNHSPIFDTKPINVGLDFKVLVAIAESDSPSFHNQHSKFIEFLKLKKINAENLLVPKVDHFNIAEKLCMSSHILTERIIKLIFNINDC